MTRTDLTFTSHGSPVAAWRYTADDDGFAGPAGRPCVVMAHGFGATRDAGLEGFAEELAAAGLDALVFDYRGFGASGGDRRQVADVPGQLHDYRAAVAFARGLDGVDPDRIVLWGVSFSGGHVFALAAEDSRIAATVAMTPASDGAAAALAIVKREGVPGALRSTVAGLRDVLSTRLGRGPVLVPLAAMPGELAALNAPGAYEAYTGIAGETWRNEVAARAFLQLPLYRPGRAARRIDGPILVQIADLDQSAPPAAAAAAAARAPRSEVRHYPCDHFDIYPGRPWHAAAVAHQLGFLRRHLAVRDAVTA
ncbi:alpha/beta hydrolase [Pseudonocardia halophobica]|uniref:alpha/beta hydrolase n=1 Tax=Pseudonocardia halophobica TaxID=29401 RepID=UPI00055D72FA|nr:alpha/beta fold hydrolase [Pseudonocardia halophobica]